MSIKRSYVMLLVSLVCFAAAGAAQAQDNSALMPGLPPPPDLEQVKRSDVSAVGRIDEEHPERAILSPEEANRNPLEMGYVLMDLIARGEAAIQRGDHQAAIRYFKAIAKGTPERAVSFSKICRSYKALGEIEQAIEFCEQALGKGGVTSDDYATYVRLMLSREQAPEPAEVEKLDAIFAHLELEMGVEKPAKAMIAQLRCELATRLEDDKRLAACVDVLAKVAPKDPRTFTFGWALAVRQRDFERAEAIVSEARAAGIPAAAVQEMESKLAAEREKLPGWLNFVTDWRILLTFALAVLMLVAMTVAGRRGNLRTAA